MTNPFFRFAALGREVRGAFINTAQEPCSIHESGRMVFSCLSGSDAYRLDYFSLDVIDIGAFAQTGTIVRRDGVPVDHHYDFMIFNWHFVTMAGAVPLAQIARLDCLKFAILLELEPGNPLRYIDDDVFDGYIALDPAAESTGKIFTFPRPLEGRMRPARPIRDIPVISSFGFGTPAKGFEQVVAAVNKEFERAVVRINVPPGAYTAGTDSVHWTSYPKYLERMCRSVAKKGVEIRFTFDFMEPRELVDWCADSDLNCFLYTRRQPGLSATTDQAIVSGQPLITGTNDTFRHIHRYIPPYPLLSLREALEVTPPLVRRLQEDWSPEGFARTFERMLHAFGLGASGSVVGLRPQQPSIVTRRLLVLTPRACGSRGILDYERRLADCLGRSGTFQVTLATARSPAERASAIAEHRPWGVIAVDGGMAEDEVEGLGEMVEGSVVQVLSGQPRSAGMGPDVVERLPIIPYYTVFVSGPKRTRVYLLGFGAEGSNLEQVVARVAAEMADAELLVEAAETSSAAARIEALVSSHPSLAVEAVPILTTDSEVIATFGACSMVIAYHDPRRSAELEDLVSLALATERAVVFTEAAPFPQFPAGTNTFEGSSSLSERIGAGISGQIDLLSRFIESETVARVAPLLSPGSLDASRQPVPDAPPVGPDGDSDLYVRAAYFRMLGRAPDMMGLAHHARALDAGMDLGEFIGGLLFASEGRAYAARIADRQGLNDIDAGGPRDFMNAAYNAVLGREFDGEIAEGALAEVAPRLKVLGDLLLSPEGLIRYADLIRIRSDRLEEQRRGAVATWVAQNEAAASAQPSEPPSISWQELATRRGEDFIHGVYWRLLGRSPDPDGFNNAAANLRNGGSEATIAGNILLSPEGRSRLGPYWPEFAARLEGLLPLADPDFIAGSYRLFQGHKPDGDVLAAATGHLGSGLSRSSLIGDLLLSAESLAQLTARQFAETAANAEPAPPRRSLVERVSERRIFVLTVATDEVRERMFSPYQRQLIATLIHQGEAVRVVRWSPSERRLVMMTRSEIQPLGTGAASSRCVASHPALTEDVVHVDVPGSSQDWLLVAGSIRRSLETDYLHEMNAVLEARRLGLSVAFVLAGAAALRRASPAEADVERLSMQAMLLADVVIPTSTLARNDILLSLKQDQGADFGPRIEKINAPRVDDVYAWPVYGRRLRGLLTAAKQPSAFLGPIHIAEMPRAHRGNHDLSKALEGLGIEVFSVDCSSLGSGRLGKPAPDRPGRMCHAAWLLVPPAALAMVDDWDAVFAFAAREKLRLAALLAEGRIDRSLHAVLLRFDRVFAPDAISYTNLRSVLRRSREPLTCAEDRFKSIEGPHELPAAVRPPLRAGGRVRAVALVVSDGESDPIAFGRRAARTFESGLDITICSLGVPLPASDPRLVGDEPGLGIAIAGEAEACVEGHYDFAVVLATGPTATLMTSELAARGTPVLVVGTGDGDAMESSGIVTVDVRDPDQLARALAHMADPAWRSLLRNEGLNRPARSWRAYVSDILSDLVAEDARNTIELLPTPMADMAKAFPYRTGRPKLSICISTYQRAEWLALSLRNIFQQLDTSRDDIEVLVVDNASPDHTHRVIEPFRTYKDFVYYRNPHNVGMLGNLAVTAQRARGEYIWILGDDDLIRHGAISRIVKAIDTHPRVGLIYINYGYSSEKDPSSVHNINDYLEDFNTLEPEGPDFFGRVADVAAKNENFFTAIYAHIFRRDHALRSYCQDTSGRTFSTLTNCVPTAKYILDWMMDDDVYWIGKQCLVVNSNVSWAAYGPMFDLEHLPRCWDLAEWRGSPALAVDRRRTNRLWLIEMMWRDLFENDTVNNADYLDVEQIILRLKHLEAFDDRVSALREVYTRAYQRGAAAAKLPPNELFSAFVLDAKLDLAHSEVWIEAG